MNVYTYPAFRRRGLAEALVRAAVIWCRDNDISAVTLHFSDDGRQLYERMGFALHNEMIIWSKSMTQPD